MHWFRIAYRSTWRQMELQNERIQITTWKYQMQIYTKNNKYGWIACNDRENSHFRRCYTFIIIHRYFPIEKCLEFICNVHLIWMADTDKHTGMRRRGERRTPTPFPLNTEHWLHVSSTLISIRTLSFGKVSNLLFNIQVHFWKINVSGSAIFLSRYDSCFFSPHSLYQIMRVYNMHHFVSHIIRVVASFRQINIHMLLTFGI